MEIDTPLFFLFFLGEYRVFDFEVVILFFFCFYLARRRAWMRGMGWDRLIKEFDRERGLGTSSWLRSSAIVQCVYADDMY